MEEAYSFKKTSWLVNPWFDSILLTGFPVVLIFMYLSNYIYLHFPKAFLSLYSYWSFKSLLPHFFITLSVVYLDSQVWKGKAIQFLWIPFFIVVATTIFWVSGFAKLIITITLYIVIWHILAQNCVILKVHKLRNKDCQRLDSIIDNTALIIGPTYFFLKFLASERLKYEFASVSRVTINPYILNYLCILTWLSIAAFILRQTYLFIRWKRINIFKISMCFMTIVTFYYSLMLIRDSGIFVIGVFRGVHFIQYVAGAWFYHRKKFERGIIKEAKVLSYLSQPGRGGLYILFIILLNLATILIVIGISSLSSNPQSTSFLLYIIRSDLHVFFDAFIWKIPSVHNIVNA